MPPTIISESSSITYDEYRKARKRPHSDTDTDAGAPDFHYMPAKDQPVLMPPPPAYYCYPNQAGAPFMVPPHMQPQYHPVPAIQAMPAIGYPSGYQQYQCYPAGMTSANPIIIPDSAPQQVPAKPDEPAKPKATATEGNWLGRTKAQVEADNIKIAARENVFKNDQMKPKDAKADQLFWVVEIDGRTNLRMFQVIDEDLGPGRWERDPRFGNAYFQREEAEEDK